MNIYSVLFSSLLVLLLSGTSYAKRAAALEVTAKESCLEHIVSTPRLTANDWPKRARGREVNAYVVMTYSLDGSGRATHLQLVSSVPAGLFDKTTRSLLVRTEFTPGVSVDSCTYVRTYGSVKRSVL